ncbi:unnamed protein product [Miscanthus lutarioriparius]|uniref:Small EDRK-rich factor-like N-terminal domain-containing protein n=1 Tax=Miscanthus lutarioriparius TaxID=422564 RepID=A0A811PZM4_9POAL|nr:unnamed protein product [Miscanthus lutarioriparius]
MTRGKQKIDAQRRNAERNQKSKGSQLEARAVGLKVVCPICKMYLQTVCDRHGTGMMRKIYDHNHVPMFVAFYNMVCASAFPTPPDPNGRAPAV